MSTAAHTPGPWEYRPLQFDDWGWVRGPKDSEGYQALVACARSGTLRDEDLDSHRRNGTDPWEANARLIAAAPDLLAACIDLTDQLALLANDPKKNPWVKQGRSALAKAEGRS